MRFVPFRKEVAVLFLRFSFWEFLDEESLGEGGIEIGS